MENGFIAGWKNIAKHFNCSVRTVKRYFYEFGMPIIRLPGNKPAILPDEVKRWALEFTNLRSKKKRKQIAAFGIVKKKYPSPK